MKESDENILNFWGSVVPMKAIVQLLVPDMGMI